MGAVHVGHEWRWTRPGFYISTCDAKEGIRMDEGPGARGVGCKLASQEGMDGRTMGNRDYRAQRSARTAGELRRGRGIASGAIG
jgi:hypothetical protein